MIADVKDSRWYIVIFEYGIHMSMMEKMKEKHYTGFVSFVRSIPPVTAKNC